MTPTMLRSVKIDTEACWPWAGCKDRHGYGKVGRQGQVLPAHRVMYEALVGPIPDGLEIDHLCRNIVCVNPSHLEPVTRQENMRRRAAAQTHCHRGHPFSDENTYVAQDSTRRACRACGRIRFHKAAS